jgi:hypothetical protein
MPASVEDRDADVWEALLAVANLAGGHWPETGRAAAAALVAASRQRSPSIGVLLLCHIKKIFDARRADRLPAEEIIAGLLDMDEAPWETIRKGDPIDARSLASRLRKYGISSKLHRAAGRFKVFKGYSRAQFEDAWKRYVDELDYDDDGSPRQEIYRLHRLQPRTTMVPTCSPPVMV